jgi:hypothetical protein
MEMDSADNSYRTYLALLFWLLFANILPIVKSRRLRNVEVGNKGNLSHEKFQVPLRTFHEIWNSNT